MAIQIKYDRNLGLVQELGDGGLLFTPKTNSASAAPTTSNDASEGYEVGSRWWDTANDTEYVLLDAAIGAANWIATTSGSVGGSGGGSGTGADRAASYIVAGVTSSLPNERELTAGTGINFTDGGAGSTFTAFIDDSVVATVSGTTFTGAVVGELGLSGSLTHLADGSSYLVAGNQNITIVSQSNGSVTITLNNGNEVTIQEFGGTWDQQWNGGDPPADVASAITLGANYLSSNPGSTLIFPPGHYQLTEVPLIDIEDCAVFAYGAVFHITETTPTETNGGIQLSGTINNFSWLGGTFIGDGNANSSAAGIWARSNNTRITNTSIADVCVQSSSLGISFTLDNDGGTSYIRRSVINNCKFEHIVGSNPGEGYGVALANFDPDIDAQVSVTNCTFKSAQRHGLYIARGMGYNVKSCDFVDHLVGFANPNGERAAYTVARTKNVKSHDLNFTNSANASIFVGVGSASNEDSRHVQFDGIRITNPTGSYSQILIGGTFGEPSSSTGQRDIRFYNVDCYASSSNWTGASFLRFDYGHDVFVENSSFERLGMDSASTELVTFNALSGSGAVDDFSSNWRFERCLFRVSGSSGRALRFDSTVLSASLIDVDFTECKIYSGTLTDFSLDGSVINDRIQFTPATRYLSADDFSLSSGWGDAATLTISPGSTNKRGSFTILAGGSGITASPTVSIHTDGYFKAPDVGARLIDASTTLHNPVSSSHISNTSLRITYLGTLSSGNSVTIEYGIGPERVKNQQALYGFTSAGSAQRIARLTTDSVVELGSPGVATTTLNFGTTLQATRAGTTAIANINANGLEVLEGYLAFPEYNDGTLPTPAADERAIVFNSTDDDINVWNGSSWSQPGGGGGGGAATGGPIGQTIEVIQSTVSSSVYDNDVAYIPMRNNALDQIDFQFVSTVTGSLTASFYYAMSTSEANSISLQFDYLTLGLGDSPTTARTLGTAFNLTPGSDTNIHSASSNEDSSLAFNARVGDTVYCRLTRSGSDDTHTGDFRVINVRVSS